MPPSAQRGVGIYPQPGFQERALATPADIAIIGGSAGGGKTYALLMEAARHQSVGDFRAVFFRRTSPQITNAGGLWDASQKLYPALRAVPRGQQMDWQFPSGAKVQFRHMQHETDRLAWQGTEVALIIFDELTHFTSDMFWYMLSRNRSTCGVRPYVRCSCNPEPDHWVAELIAWWIDQDEHHPDGSPNPRFGLPIPERVGVLRYFTRHENDLVWGDTPGEVRAKAPHLFEGPLANVQPKSLTFIPGTVYENKKLLDSDPGYLGNLMAQNAADKAMLLDGNWKVKIDGLALYESARLSDLFTNLLAQPARPRRYITCDAAGFGRDFTVIFVWEGWEVVQIVVERKTDPRDIYQAIEKQRKKWQVAESDVVVDQDGVGGKVFAYGKNYKAFNGGASPLADPDTKEVERYVNLKTQCYYRMADRVNGATVAVRVDDYTVEIDGVRGVKLLLAKKETTVLLLLKADLKAVKRAPSDADKRKAINSKDEQKALLGGRSPDFGDTFMMREWFELRHEVKPWFLKRA
ncbi:MAG: terminase large subunit domain-containing protein [Janthinobacterium lividum]